MTTTQQYPAENVPRAPNEIELQQLWLWMKAMHHDDNYCLDEQDWFRGFYIAVFDHYCTGCPGYSGKLLYLVWDGTPDCCDVFVWKGSEMIHYAQHSDMCDTLSVSTERES